eukprot:Amastigsp_a3831_22.p5 type:complete len:111 gc:universal Amastigsp_a3831_22:1126-794(-)
MNGNKQSVSCKRGRAKGPRAVLVVASVLHERAERAHLCPAREDLDRAPERRVDDPIGTTASIAANVGPEAHESSVCRVEHGPERAFHAVKGRVVVADPPRKDHRAWGERP